MSDDRLLARPVFVLAAPRSGSTLLRAILGTHTELWAPHEIPLTRLTVDVPFGMPLLATKMLGYDQAALEYLLWDRLLHAELLRSGKRTLVLKSPIDTLAWERLAACWTDARYVILLRHPGSIVDSWEALLGHDRAASAAHLLKFMTALDGARTAGLDAVTVRYEQLLDDPAAEISRVCEHLGVSFEPGMLAYQGQFRRGVGDWTEKIHSGRIQAGRPLPAADRVPELLHPIAAAWGY